MRMRLSLLIGIAAFIKLFSGCTPVQYTPPPPPMYFATYDISLSEVERPAQAKERYGEQKIEKVQEKEIFKYYFEDEMVRILWIPTSSGISFILNNKTGHSIKIIWDEAAFVDENGGSHRVMHSGVKYIDRNSSQPPTVVVRKGKIEDFVFPTDYIYWKKGYYGIYYSEPGEWEKLPLIPNFQSGGTIDELQNKANSYVGKTLQILLPLKIEDIVNDYIFTFKINNVVVKQK